VSRSLARRAYGDEEPLGRAFRTGGRDFTVIGVVGDVATVASGEAAETVYLSHDQFADDRNWSLTYAVRTAGDPDALLKAARSALASIDPALVLHRPRSMDAVLAQHRARDRFVLLLMTAFGAVALSLAAVGVYGVLSYVVSQRVHEIGVRMALGARSSQLRSLVIGQGMRVAGAGAVAGLLGAVALGGVLQALAPNVAARDPVVLAAAVVVLTVAVALAAYVPARRATSVNPLQALHKD
jgi:predicted lysophospholipase L1 biosynthesis ABC-type transport system permease subunit